MPRLARALIAVGARIVPVLRRAAWRRQWRAELEHRRASGAGDVAVVRLALGAIPHALYLWRESWSVAGWTAELRHSVRALLRRPGFSLLTMGTLAIGIGAAAAVFSLAEAMLLRPLPLEDGDRLVRILSTNPTAGHGWFSVSYPDYEDFSERDDLFVSTSLYSEQRRDVSGEGDPERVRTASVHTGYFGTLRSRTVAGRLFSEGDHRADAVLTAVLAESFWLRRFGADPMAIGREIRLDGVPHTIVGVLEDGQGWPTGVDVWTPLPWGGGAPAWADVRSNHAWQVVARLRDGVRASDASTQLHAMSKAIYTGPEIDERDVGIRALVVPLRASEGGDDAGALFGTLGAAVLFVLLLACMNASGLLLTRTWGRARELSLRAALGAGRLRLAGILLGETVVLAVTGGLAGIWLGTVALERAWSMAPPQITALGEVRLNATVGLVGLGISGIAALVAGVVPAVRASRISLADSLRDGSAQAGQGWGVTRLRRVLVVGEVALALTLLVAAGLTVRGFQRQIATDPGFEADRLVSFTVRLPPDRYGEDALVDAFYRDATDRLTRHPAIVSASATSRLPLGAGGLGLTRAFLFDGAVPPPEGDTWAAAWVEVDPAWFESVGVSAAEGRVITADDANDAPLVAVVTREMARRMSPDGSIVGRSIRSHYDENLARTVVGVIPDVQINGVSRRPLQPVVLVPRSQSVRSSMAFLVRTSGDPAAALPAVRAVMAELDGDIALDALQPLRAAHAADLGGIRFLTTLFAAFGGLALLLAVSGVYGLVSYSVSQRRQEIGVRMAVGATVGRVRRAVLRESIVLAGVGLLLGGGLAYAAARILAVGMDGIAVLEPSTFIAVAAGLALAVVVATWLPATRASRVDPAEALRSE